MPRRARSIIGGYVYHVLNRANGRLRLFKKDGDFAAFEQVVSEARERVPLRILGYVVMSNHWHFVVWPRQRRDGEVTDFFRWLTLTHSQRWHAHHGTSGMGHIYQGRFKSFPIAADEHFLKVLRYVERNPLRAGLVSRAEDWRWGSLYRRTRGIADEMALLAGVESKGTGIVVSTPAGLEKKLGGPSGSGALDSDVPPQEPPGQERGTRGGSGK
jgi:putative transposase